MQLFKKFNVFLIVFILIFLKVKELNALENKVLRGKIKAAIVKAKRNK